jgi:hypothetical protein
MFSLTDEAPEQKLGSIKITAPPAPGGFAITVAGVSGPAGSIVTATTTTVVFKTLDITPGTTKSVTIPARVPCGTGTYAWSTTARQSNQFNGPPGNYMLLTANSELTSTISGSCTIEFMNEPKGTLVGKSITTTFDNTPAGSSIAVGVYSGMPGTPVLLPAFSGTISVSLLGGPAGATLSGNTVVMHSGGSATFSFGTLSITAPGMGYQLEAESNVPGVQSAHSVPFAIYQTLTKCTSSHCSGAAKGSTVTLSSAATLSGTRSGTGQGFLGLGFEQIPGFTAVTSCGGYKIGILSATTSFEVLKATGNAAPKTATTSWDGHRRDQQVSRADKEAAPPVPQRLADLLRVDDTVHDCHRRHRTHILHDLDPNNSHHVLLRTTPGLLEHARRSLRPLEEQGLRRRRGHHLPRLW